MALYEFNVYETLTVKRLYLVEAGDPKAAIRKANSGDTVAEYDLSQPEVRDRDVYLNGRKEEREDEAR
jgi:hypothetical protein